MNGVVEMNLIQFGLVYLLLLVILVIMKKSKVNQTKLLLIASMRMTVQLVLAGFIITYIFKNPHPAFTILYMGIMVIFSIHRITTKNQKLNKRFKWIIGCAIGGAGVAVILFFVKVVVGVSLFDPQYIIPISGMIIGNAMTGVSLGIRAFYENLTNQQNQINVLLNIGVTPKKILLPFVNQALETALLPTLNSMLGMGIISLPGMMTGQILSGTLPTTAILYQISIMIAICTVVCVAVFSSLYFGYKTLYNKRNQINIYGKF